MKIAVKFGSLSKEPLVSPSGELIMSGGGSALVYRLFQIYPDAVFIGPEKRMCKDFEMVTLDEIDVDSTVVINMDVMDSLCVFQRLHRNGADPKIMNFQWLNPSTYHHRANFAALGASYAMFPTFCSGERTASEVREVLRMWAVQPLAEKALISWADLGVRTERLQPRRNTDIPVVLYPAISMQERKQPMRFISIVENVQKRTPIKVVARLNESSLVTEPALKLGSHNDWAWVGPLRTERSDYWSELAATTAFVATATEEAYGLEYVEAMLSGAIGIFPDREWATALLPKGYPFIYHDQNQAEQLLAHAVQHYDECCRELDKLVEGSFTDWVGKHHDREDFDEKFTAQLSRWFGN